MSDRRDILEIIGRPGAVAQELFGEFLWRLVSNIAAGARRLWSKPYGAWAFLALSGLSVGFYLPSREFWETWLGTPAALRDFVTVLAAPAAILTLFLLARRTKAIEEQVKITEQGHITERYTRAVELLGNDNPAVRMGAIHALERLANDSKEDYATIVATLCSYVRAQLRH